MRGFIGTCMGILALSALMSCATGQAAGGQAAAPTTPAAAELSEGKRLALAREKMQAINELRNRDWNSIDWAAVLDLANEVIALNPDQADAYWSKGDAYDYFNLPQKAIPVWMKYIELRPGRGDTYAHLAMEYERTGDTAKAKELFQKAVEKDPSNWWSWEIYGNFLTWTLLDYAKAVEAYDRSFALHTEGQINGWAYRNRGHAHERLGQREAAIADYRLAVAAGKEQKDANMVAEIERLLAALTK